MPTRHRAAVLAVLAALAATGCSTRAWSDGLQAAARNACQMLPSTERERCEAQLNRQDFGAYERSRTSSP